MHECIMVQVCFWCKNGRSLHSSTRLCLRRGIAHSSCRLPALWHARLRLLGRMIVPPITASALSRMSHAPQTIVRQHTCVMGGLKPSGDHSSS